MHEFDMTVNVVITFLHQNTYPPLTTIFAGNKAGQSDVIV
jgi:hypothetical protein